MAERTRRVTQSLKEKYPLEKLHTHSFDGTEAERAIQTLAGAFPDEQAVHIAIVPQPFPFCIYPLALLSKSCYDALVQSCHATPSRT